jgi:hypothetical protein
LVEVARATRYVLVMALFISCVVRRAAHEHSGGHASAERGDDQRARCAQTRRAMSRRSRGLHRHERRDARSPWSLRATIAPRIIVPVTRPEFLQVGA